MKKKNILLGLFVFFSQVSYSQKILDSLLKNKHFEVSFGQSLLFISNTTQANFLSSTDIVVPTSAILLFAEFRPEKIARIPVYINFPTESKQY